MKSMDLLSHSASLPTPHPPHSCLEDTESSTEDETSSKLIKTSRKTPALQDEQEVLQVTEIEEVRMLFDGYNQLRQS